MKDTQRLLLASVTALMFMVSGCGSDSNNSGTPIAGQYKSTALVSDGSIPAPHTDPNLRNGWGIAFGSTSAVWVADNGAQVATLYDGDGVAQPLVVNIPAGANGPSSPTGIVSNPTSDFLIGAQNPSKAAFIFAGEAGTISAWSPQVDPTNAVIAYDDAGGGAVYKGLALASNGVGNFLYATDFYNNKIDVFDTTFAKVNLPGAFVDPFLPADFAPFGIQTINGKLYVTYAQQDPTGRIQVTGPGLGIVDVFDPNGTLLQRLVTGEEINAPWGIALAPANFGTFSNHILVGNFGDGKINAYEPTTGEFAGPLAQQDGTGISLQGLWGIAFGNGSHNQPTNTLFYAAGPNKKLAGVYGRIDAQ